MQTEWHPITDGRGVRGSVTSSPSDPSSLEVRLENGRFLLVPRARVTGGADGTYHYADVFANLLEREAREVVVPIVEEDVEISKRAVEKDRVRLVTSVSTREEPVDVTLLQEDLTVERVPIGRVVEAAAAPRQEGDTFVVPVYEEVLVVEKRLVLREEIRVTRKRREEHAAQTVTLRREEVRVERARPGGET